MSILVKLGASQAFISIAVGALVMALASPALMASDEHQHEEHHEMRAEKGPNGGLLLSEGNVSLEVTIFEQGVDPEMRVFGYRDGVALAPSELSLQVELQRLGGRVDQLSFQSEQNYLVSDQVIVEPHSYDVSVRLNLDGKNFQWSYPSHEGRSQISARMQQEAGIRVEPLAPAVLQFRSTLFGVIAADPDRFARIYAPFTSQVRKIYVKPGDRVEAGQVLLELTNLSSQQRYRITSPIAGEVTERNVAMGDRAEQQMLLEVSDLSKVWVEMSAFPEDIEKLAVGQPVKVYDLHQHEIAEGRVEYIAPEMTGGHIARAVASIDNPNGHWRPGMHVKSDVLVKEKSVERAVKLSAVQRFRGMEVVFAQFGDTFEVRMVELGERDENYAEVLGGIEDEARYVSENSFLLKADVLKDGASHDH